jgi:hypothetical protein
MYELGLLYHKQGLGRFEDNFSYVWDILGRSILGYSWDTSTLTHSHIVKATMW